MIPDNLLAINAYMSPEVQQEAKGLKADRNFTTLFFFFFFKYFWRTYTHVSYFGALIPLFWISGDVSSGFQSQSGLPYSHCGGERNVRSLRSTSGATRCRPLDGKHCRAPTGFISCPRILLCGSSESQTRDQQIMSAAR